MDITILLSEDDIKLEQTGRRWQLQSEQANVVFSEAAIEKIAGQYLAAKFKNQPLPDLSEFIEQWQEPASELEYKDSF